MMKLLIVLSFFASFLANAAIKCGETDVSVMNTTYDVELGEKGYFLVSAINKNINTSYKITQELGYLRLRCEQGAKGDYFVIINPLCHSASCSEDNYQLVSVSDGKIVVSLPEKLTGGNNRKDIESFLGKNISEFSCGYDYGTEPTPNKQDEICMVTKRDQG